MKTNRLGRTGYEVGALGLGCYQFTGEFGVSPDASREIMDFAMRSEINFFDTAQMYGFGESEEIVGRGLLAYPDKKAIVSTKVGYLHDRTVSRTRGMGAYTDVVELKRAVKHSLWLLRREFVEVLMIHEPAANDWWGFDYDTGDCVALSVLEELKAEGVIGSIGLGCWNTRVLARLVSTGRIDVALSAGGVTLLQKPMFDELVPAAKKHDVGLVVGGCFGQNNPHLLHKDRHALESLLQGSAPPSRHAVATHRKLLALYDLADELGVSMPELTIRYVMSLPEIHVHIPGAREAAHLATNLAAANKGALDDDIVRRIGDIQSLVP
jgi:aryl-alcohol dehydrogenase-like predicted oxidoreductase